MAPNDYGPTIEVTAFTLASLSTAIVALRYAFHDASLQNLIEKSGYTATSIC